MKKFKKSKSANVLSKFQRTLLGAGLVSLSTASIAAYCVYQDPAFIGIVANAQATINSGIKANHTAIEKAFDASMAGMDTATSLALTQERERITSAIAVWTKQKSLSDNLLAENQINLNKQTASIDQALEKKKRVIKAEEEFGASGQGHKVCVVTAERSTAKSIQEENQKSVPSRISGEVVGAPGAWGDPYKAKVDMLNDHKSQYCTPQQAQAGYCAKVGDLAGLNLQGSTLFTETQQGSDIHQAQNSMINLMVGAPDRPIESKFANSPNAVTYNAAKSHKDTIIAPAVYSLKAIQAEFVPADTHAGGSGNISPIKAIDQQVARYLGDTEEYKSWNKTLVSGSERGIMKELLQVKALDLYLIARQYKQNERKELLLAGILAAEQLHLDKADASAGASGGSTEEKRWKLESARVTDAIFNTSNNRPAANAAPAGN